MLFQRSSVLSVSLSEAETETEKMEIMTDSDAADAIWKEIEVSER